MAWPAKNAYGIFVISIGTFKINTSIKKYFRAEGKSEFHNYRYNYKFESFHLEYKPEHKKNITYFLSKYEIDNIIPTKYIPKYPEFKRRYLYTPNNVIDNNPQFHNIKIIN